MSAVTSEPVIRVDIDRLRHSFSLGLLGLIWVMMIAVSAIAAVTVPASFVAVTGIAAALSLLPTAAFLTTRVSHSTSVSIAVSIAGLLALLVYNFRWNGDGVAYQIDMHMAFFAGLALLTGLMNWRALVAYTGVVAFHHLGAAFFLPAIAFPDGAPILRVLLHGGILSLECGVLLWLNHQVWSLTAANTAALAQAQREQQIARDAQAEANRLRADAERKAESDRKRYADLRSYAEQFRLEAESMMQQLLSNMDRMQETAQALETSSKSSQQRAVIMDRATVGASDSVASVASAATQLSASIEEIVSQIANSSSMIGDATQTAGHSRQKVSELAASAEEIGNVIQLIQDIAEQTNLLALNATIEAARAGDAGRGFAVVASEVKQLAGQTARAVQVISDLVAAIQSVTDDTTSSISKIADQMDKVSGYTHEVARAIDQQSAATSEISESVTLASQNTGRAAEEVRTVIETAEQNHKAAKSILESSQEVSAAGQRLRRQIEQFINRAVA